MELRAGILNLDECCPVEDCNPEECPLYQLRKMKPLQRLEWLNALSEDDLAYLVAYHDVCINFKLIQLSTDQNLLCSIVHAC